jgi:hypothetical protein
MTRRFSKGKKARAICDRSGREYPMREMVIEPGTNLLVHRSESDGKWSLNKHPQNFPPKKIGEASGIKNARPETGLPDGTLDYLVEASGGSGILVGGLYEMFVMTSGNSTG